MKRTIYSMFALAAGLSLSLTSCSGDEPVPSESKTTLNFQLSIPSDYYTRALGDENTIDINTLNYSIFDENDNLILSDKKGKLNITESNLSVDISLDVMPQMTYTIVFYASNSISTFSEYTNGVITLNYNNAAANSEQDDAFSGKLTFTVAGDSNNFSCTLNHTFAQINFGTYDADSGTESYKSSLSIPEGLSQQLNLLTGVVSEPIENVVLNASFPTSDFGFPGNESVKLVQMNYVLPSENTIPSLVFTSYNGTDEINSFTISDLQVGLNYRTNISGNLFTKKSSDIIANIIK